VTFAAERLKRL